MVLDTTDFQMTHEARDSTKWLTDMKYSPNGELLAIGGYDHKIYIYSVNSGYALNGVVGQHQSFITALDFSEDSLWLRSNCGGFELFYFEADTVHTHRHTYIHTYIHINRRPFFSPIAGFVHPGGGEAEGHGVGHADLQHDLVGVRPLAALPAMG